MENKVSDLLLCFMQSLYQIYLQSQQLYKVILQMQNFKEHKNHLPLFKDHRYIQENGKTIQRHQNQEQARKLTNKERIKHCSNLDLLKQIRFLKERVRCKVLTKLSSNTSCQSPKIGKDDFRNAKQKILQEKQRRQKERKPKAEQFHNLYELKDLEYLTFGIIKQNPTIVSLINFNNSDDENQRAEKTILRRRKTENQSL